MGGDRRMAAVCRQPPAGSSNPAPARLVEPAPSFRYHRQACSAGAGPGARAGPPGPGRDGGSVSLPNLRLPVPRGVLAAALLVLLAACALPRGAALQTEILDETRRPGIAVVAVTRESLPDLAGWPATGTPVSGGWPAADRGGVRVIRPGDAIDLTIWDNQENSLLVSGAEKAVRIEGVTVSPQGTVFLPYIDALAIAGRTPEAARAEIQARLAPIIPAAQVLLQVRPGGENTADLVTGVARPGRYPLSEGRVTILSLIAEGGGIQPALRNPLVRLQREGRSYSLPAAELFQNPARNIALRGGDRVVIEADPRYFIALGAAGAEQTVHFDKAEITALDALALIGGLSDQRANLKGVMVLREYPAAAVRADGRGPPERQVIFTFDLTTADGLFAARRFQIRSEDVVLATESVIPGVNVIFNLFGAALGIANRI